MCTLYVSRSAESRLKSARAVGDFNRLLLILVGADLSGSRAEEHKHTPHPPRERGGGPRLAGGRLSPRLHEGQEVSAASSEAEDTCLRSKVLPALLARTVFLSLGVPDEVFPLL